MQEQITQLQNQIKEMQLVINSLRANATIPFDIGEAFKARLEKGDVFGEANTNTEVKSVNEAGSATYDVAKKMDGLIPVTLKGQVYKIPYYN